MPLPLKWTIGGGGFAQNNSFFVEKKMSNDISQKLLGIFLPNSSITYDGIEAIRPYMERF